MSDESNGDISFLSRSPVRVTLLKRLATASAQPATLVEHADVSRTTVHRTLNELVERGWVQRSGEGYAITGTGNLALQTFEEARARFRTLDRLGPFWDHVEDGLGLDPGWLEDARVQRASGENPQRPLEWYADRLEAIDGDELEGISPIVNRQVMAVHGPVVFAGTPVELIIGESTFQIVRDRYADRLRESIELENYRLLVTDDSPTVGLTRYGDRVFLGAYDGDRRLVAVVESDRDELREWADHHYQRYRTNARHVTSDVVASTD